ncbi:MAG: hypothetical protein QF605_02725 [Rhodospirillales bacterium]|nr:hypothetical protein [Rhodospirillales bacterium]
MNGIIKVITKIPKKNKKWDRRKLDASTSMAPFKILNLGNGKRISLLKYIRIIEKNLGKKDRNANPIIVSLFKIGMPQAEIFWEMLEMV